MTNRQKRFAIREAMTKLQSIQFTYKGEKTSRIGNPHASGFTKDGTESLRIYQTDGPSSKGLSKNQKNGDNFRFFNLQDIDSVEILLNEFKIHPVFKCCDESIDWNKRPNKQVKSSCSCN